MRRRSARLGLILGAVLLLPACIQMPSEGPVTEVDSDSVTPSTPGIYFDPKPPQAGESATEIVTHFLEAMKATPVKTSVARQFLTPDAQRRWAPDSAVITYAELGDPVGDGVEVMSAMTGLEEYDARGAWQRSRLRKTMRFGLTSDRGEWRIDQLPDALIVPESWFEDQYRRVSLYFFDPTVRILVPEPAFVPDGEQQASSLVRGLLNDPTPDPRLIRTFLPPGFTSRLGAVPITPAGVAEVTLVGDPDVLDEATIQRIVTQLVWTMRQDTRIRAVRLSIGEEELSLPGGVTQIALDVGSEFDPNGAQSSGDLFGLVEGKLVRGSIGSLLATPGPMGAERLGVRSIGVSLRGERVAGVSGDGTALLVAPVDSEGSAVQVVSGARDLLPPAWDFADRIWLADRARGGSRISVVTGESRRALEVPGMSGRDVRHLLVSRDGSRLVAVIRTAKGDRIVASRILHDDAGGVLRATQAQLLDFGPENTTGVIRDIAWRSPTAISVLTDITDDLSEVATISVDGAPGELATEGASRLRGGTRELVSSPVEGAEVFGLARASVADLTAPERPVGPLPKRLASLTYVG